jgi:hypothetical protein
VDPASRIPRIEIRCDQSLFFLASDLMAIVVYEAFFVTPAVGAKELGLALIR